LVKLDYLLLVPQDISSLE